MGWYIGSLHRFLRLLPLLIGCLLSGAALAASETGEDIRDLAGIQQHPIRFIIPTAYLQGSSADEVKLRLTKMVVDLNAIFARRTIRRFVLDPQTGFTFTDTPPSTTFSGESIGLYRYRSYGVQVWLRMDPGHSSMSIAENGDTEVGLRLYSLLDRDNLGTDIVPGTGLSSLNYYWTTLKTLSHEILHGFGAGAPEYYAFNNRQDPTGIDPIIHADINYDKSVHRYWLEHRDYDVDPMGRTERSDRSIDQRIADFELAELTRLRANGLRREDVLEIYAPTPDLSAVDIRVRKADGVSSPGAVRMMIWSMSAHSNNYVTLLFDGYTANDGSHTQNWVITPPNDLGLQTWLLIKAWPNDPTEQPVVRWLNIFDANEEKLLFGRDTLKVRLNFEGSDLPPSAAAKVTMVGAEDSPVTVSYQDLANRASLIDPFDQPIHFRLLRQFRGKLMTETGEAVNHESQLLPGETWYWTPPLNMHGADIPAFLLQARNPTSGAINPTEIRVNLSPEPDLPRVFERRVILSETDSTWVTCLPVDDPDGGVAEQIILSPPVHVLLTDGLSQRNGRCFYLQSTGVAGLRTLTFEARNSQGSTGPVTLPIEIQNVDDDAPTIIPTSLSYNINEDSALQFLSGDLLNALRALSIDGQPLALKINAITSGSLRRGDGTLINVGEVLASDQRFTWLPPSNLSGNVGAFSVKAIDDLSSVVSNNLFVNIAAINDPPSLNMIHAQAIQENQSVCVPLTGLGPGGGTDEQAQALTVAAVSSNPALVAHGSANSLLIFEPGNTLCLRIRPRDGAFGNTNITVSVTDSLGAVTNRTFALTVTLVNSAPQFVSGVRKFLTTGITHWVPMFRDLSVMDPDHDALSCRFLSLPTHADITVNSGSRTLVQANLDYPIATFKSFFAVKRIHVTTIGLQTHNFRCSDPHGADTGAISYSVTTQ